MKEKQVAISAQTFTKNALPLTKRQKASDVDVIVNITDAKTIVDAVFFADANADGEKFSSNVVTNITVINNTIRGYNLTMYDYESDELPASVKITGPVSGFACKGILKVQYTK